MSKLLRINFSVHKKILEKKVVTTNKIKIKKYEENYKKQYDVTK